MPDFRGTSFSPVNKDEDLLGSASYVAFQTQMAEAKEAGDKQWYRNLQQAYKEALERAEKDKNKTSPVKEQRDDFRDTMALMISDLLGFGR